MEPLELREVCEATGARPVSPRVERLRFTSVSTDSRTCEPGALFVAIRGERFDGNEFAAAALERGAGGVLTAKGRAPQGPADRAILEHESPERALLDLAAHYRRKLAVPVVAIGGACGKTTTKEIAAHLLRRFVPTVASEKSFNNAVGVPATLFRIDRSTRAAVVEIGTNAPGEVAALSKAVAPDVGIITMIGEEHLEGLGSIEAAAEEEGELVAALSKKGTAVLNADDPFLPTLRRKTTARVVTFGFAAGADVRAEGAVYAPHGTDFALRGKRARLPLLGAHNVSNALAAIAAALSLGFELEAILSALADLKPPPRRLERKTFGAVEVLDDCYNANPASVRAALAALASAGSGRRVLVLGTMRELGSRSSALHRETGRAVAAARPDLLAVVGAEAGELAAGAAEGGLSAARILRFPTTEDAVRGVAEIVRPGDLVLVKGSRAEGLERVVEALRAQEAT